jgi:hypothetical protein
VPALIMHWFVPKGAPQAGVDDADIKPGGLGSARCSPRR